MAWFEDQADWYRFWEGPELMEFRARYSGKYQVPITYVVHREIAVGELGPQVPLVEETPIPEPSPAAA